MRCRTFRQMMPEVVYGELNMSRQALFDAHLAQCPECAEELAAFSKVSDQMRAFAPSPPASYWEGYWQRLRDRIAAGSGAPRHTANRRSVLYAAAASLLIAVGFSVGRLSNPPSDPSAPLSRHQLKWITMDYVGRAQVMLLTVRNSSGYPEPHLMQIRDASRELVSEAHLLEAELIHASQLEMGELVSDIAVVLMQLANANGASESALVEVVRSGIDSGQLLLRINLSFPGMSPIAPRGERDDRGAT